MQLSTPETIQILLASIAQPVRGSRRRAPAETSLKPVRAHKIQGCPRGCTCRTCCDNARWERIFQEKFADPSYYSSPTTNTTEPGTSRTPNWRVSTEITGSNDASEIAPMAAPFSALDVNRHTLL